MDFAEVEDVEFIWGQPLADAARVRVEARLAQASAIVRQADTLIGGKSVDERAAESATFATVVRGVVADMVHRLLMNPQGRLEVATDDSRVRFDASVSTGALYLSDAERSILFGAAASGRARARAFTITPGPGPVFGGSPWR